MTLVIDRNFRLTLQTKIPFSPADAATFSQTLRFPPRQICGPLKNFKICTSANALFLILLENIRAGGRDKFSSHPLETDVLEPKGTSRDGQRTRCMIH